MRGHICLLVLFILGVRNADAQSPMNCRFLLDGCADETPQPPNPPSIPPSGRQFAILSGTDLDGDDIKPWMHGLSLDNCQTVCAGTGSCQAFTFNVEKGVCILKSGNGNRKSDPNAVSGILLGGAHQSVRQYTVYNGIDLDGDDIKPWLRDASLDSCKLACSGTQVCQAFTFNTSKSVCILKYGSGNRKSDPNAISGIPSLR
jgi:hypothetical protein